MVLCKTMWNSLNVQRKCHSRLGLFLDRQFGRCSNTIIHSWDVATYFHVLSSQCNGYLLHFDKHSLTIWPIWMVCVFMSGTIKIANWRCIYASIFMSGPFRGSICLLIVTLNDSVVMLIFGFTYTLWNKTPNSFFWNQKNVIAQR